VLNIGPTALGMEDNQHTFCRGWKLNIVGLSILILKIRVLDRAVGQSQRDTKAECLRIKISSSIRVKVGELQNSLTAPPLALALHPAALETVHRRSWCFTIDSTALSSIDRPYSVEGARRESSQVMALRIEDSDVLHGIGASRQMVFSISEVQL